MAAVDVSIVTFRPELPQLQQLLDSLAAPGADVALFIHDNSPEPEVSSRVGEIAREAPFGHVDVRRSGSNVGFGRGHNANAERGAAPMLLVINQDCVLEPGALAVLLAAAETAPPDVVAWEMRQVPYEHPKAYDPVTLATGWVSGAATLFRREAFEAVGGFEPRIFMYGEDVDLSWRLRARGGRLTYQPQAAVVHHTYREAGEVKPLQVLGGVATNLCLRARFGGFARTVQGLAMLAGEMMAPQAFPGRRRGLALAFLRFLGQWPHFALTRVRPGPTFQPCFAGWGYEVRRDGAFVPFTSRRATTAPRPLVSILIRTMGRPAWLREALASCARQTYPHLEVIVVEDGSENSRAVVAEFAGRLDIRYQSTGHRVGRARAGNLALAAARGEWLNFLDDDDLLFADHVEVLLDAVQREKVAGAYGLAWEVATRFLDRDHARYEEVRQVTRHNQRFDRLVLWHHNYLPIQAVLFHRGLYERHGGFADDMDQLEDWNLWTRYTLQDDFVRVEKTTSKYRVPADATAAAGRQALLDRAYQDALERQRALLVTLSPRDISQMADAYLRSQSVVVVTQGDLRRLVSASPLLSRIASWRPVAARMLGRLKSRP
jgi:GT2 family glycosyltransferase